MSKKDEALKLALEALEFYDKQGIGRTPGGKAITAINEALAEQTAQHDMPKIGCVNHDCDKCKAQQQEPDTPKFVRNVDGVPCMTVVEHEHLMRSRPPASKPWVSLTEEEVKHQWEIWRANIPRYAGFAKGIDAKLREKNT